MGPKDQIKSRIDVVTLVGSYIKLEKSGVNFKARCPFHSEKTASFYVSPAREIWHCFGCGKGGDIFSFVMEMDGMEFPEALRMLGERVGVEVSANGTQENGERRRLVGLMEEATKFFQSELESHTDASTYLTQRGVNDESIAQFRLGFAPDSWRALSDFLKRKGYTDADMERSGIAIAGNRGLYDRFRSRIIFPLEDTAGNVIGFAGRIFGKDDVGAKYINTPQTVLYDKSRYLYGFDKAKNSIHQQKNAVLVEGNMDCILSHQAGITNAVAISGTALTDAHMKFLNRFCESLIFAFDVDAAGVEASRRALNLAHGAGFTVKIVDIEGGKDPADIVLQGPALWQKYVAEAGESIAFFLKRVLAGVTAGDPIGKKKIGEAILPLVQGLSNEIEKAHWVRELSKILKVGEEAVRRELEKIQATGTVSYAPGDVVTGENLPMSRKARLEERILGFLLLSPSFGELGELPTPDECSLETSQNLFLLLQKREIGATVEQFLTGVLPEIAHVASRLMFEAELASADLPSREAEFLNILHSWRELAIKMKLEKLREEIERLERAGDTAASQSHMQEFQELTLRLASVIANHSYYNEKIIKEKS